MFYNDLLENEGPLRTDILNREEERTARLKDGGEFVLELLLGVGCTVKITRESLTSIPQWKYFEVIDRVSAKKWRKNEFKGISKHVSHLVFEFLLI